MINFLALLTVTVKDSLKTIGDKTVLTEVKANETSISIYVQILLSVVVLFVGLGVVLYLSDQIMKHFNILKKIRKLLKDNYFVILMFFPAFYLVYHYAFYLPYSSKNLDSFWLKKETADYLLTASLTFLGTGTITGALKWLNNLAFFKKQFSDLINSDEFSNVLSNKMKDLALSDDYLLQRNDLEEIWTRVTLCKYKQKFPELAPEIQNKIENDLFLEHSLLYYYKNFITQINLSIDGDVIKIIEITSFTVISHNTDKIKINFGTTSPTEDSKEIYTKFIPDQCKCDGEVLKLVQGNGKDKSGNIDTKNIEFSAELEGKKKYIIERQIEMTQNIKEDRVFSFTSSRIIEGMSINLKYQNNLNIFFSPVGKNTFNVDNQLRSEHSQSYINRDLLLPGEKFKVFIYKKG